VASSVQEGSSNNAATKAAESTSLFPRGVEALRANDLAVAIELLSRAVALEPGDPAGGIPTPRGPEARPMRQSALVLAKDQLRSHRRFVALLDRR
jgi:hypothetical protein